MVENQAPHEIRADRPPGRWDRSDGRPVGTRDFARATRWILPVGLVLYLFLIAWIGVHLWPDLDAEHWQRWADENSGFFSPLEPGTTVAIVPELHSHMGLLVRKTAAAIRVERRLWFPFDEAPVGLIMSPEAARRLLELHYADPSFWESWHALVDEEQVAFYQHFRPRAPHADSYNAFLAKLRPVVDANGGLAPQVR